MHVTDLLSNAGESTSLATLVHWLRDPVDAGVPANLSRAFSVVAKVTTSLTAL